MIGGGGGSLTLDATHSRGPGLAVKHEVGYHGNAYYGWGSEFTWAPTWYGRVYVWFDSLPDGSARLVRSRGDGRLRFAIDLLPSGRLSLRDSENEYGRHDVIVDPHRGMGADRVDGQPCRRIGPDLAVQQPEPHGSDRNASLPDGSRSVQTPTRSISDDPGRNSRRPSSGPTTRRSARADSSGRSPDPRARGVPAMAVAGTPRSGFFGPCFFFFFFFFFFKKKYKLDLDDQRRLTCRTPLSSCPGDWSPPKSRARSSGRSGVATTRGRSTPSGRGRLEDPDLSKRDRAK